MTQPFTLTCAEGGIVKPAEIIGPFAVHLDPLELSYVVSHFYTGLKIMPFAEHDDWLNYDKAASIAHELMALDINWHSRPTAPMRVAFKRWRIERGYDPRPPTCMACEKEGHVAYHCPAIRALLFAADPPDGPPIVIVEAPDPTPPES